MEFLSRVYSAPVNSILRMWSGSYFQEYYTPSCPPQETEEMTGKLILCTGGNCGIGYETVKELALRGADVIIASRNKQKNEESVKNITDIIQERNGSGSVSYICLDLSDMDSVVNLTKELKVLYPVRKIDLLLQNAGVWPTSYSTSKQGYEICYATNVLGPHLLFLRLKQSQQLSSNCRIIYVTGDIYITVDDSSSDYLYSSAIGCQIAYSRSKLGLMWMVLEYLREFPTEFEVYLVHPGIIATGAQTTLICATAPLECPGLVKGGYYHNTCGRMILSADDPANNLQRAKDYYHMTEGYCTAFLNK